MSQAPRITLHGGPEVADGMTISVPRLAQGIVVYGTLYEPPAEPAPYYPDWYAVDWSAVNEYPVREPAHAHPPMPRA